MYQNILASYLPGNLEQYGVNGLEGVNAFPTQPNSKYVLFDRDKDYFYSFTTDASNTKSTVRRCSFVDDPIPTLEDKFVSSTEFNELKGEIANVQQSIQQLIKQFNVQQSANGTNSNREHGTNKVRSNAD